MSETTHLSPIQTVEGEHATFAYRRSGPQGRTPLVLLTRFRGTIDDWDPALINALARNHDVITVDNIGTGHTTGTPRDSMDGFATGIMEFITALGLEQVDLLGWSLGGAVAQFIVDARPDLVRRVVVAASTPGLVPSAPEPDPRAVEIQLSSAATAEDMEFLFYPDTDAGRASARESAVRIEAARPSGSIPVTDDVAMLQLMAAGGAYEVNVEDLIARLGRISQPALFANGMQDVGIPALASYFAGSHAPNSTVLLYHDAGHAFLFQHAERFASEVKLFLED